MNFYIILRGVRVRVRVRGVSAGVCFCSANPTYC